jgi:hypothetical protein
MILLTHSIVVVAGGGGGHGVGPADSDHGGGGGGGAQLWPAAYWPPQSCHRYLKNVF